MSRLCSYSKEMHIISKHALISCELNHDELVLGSLMCAKKMFPNTEQMDVVYIKNLTIELKQKTIFRQDNVLQFSAVQFRCVWCTVKAREATSSKLLSLFFFIVLSYYLSKI